VEWYTPQWVIDLVELLGPIDLDPCWAPGSLVNARRYYTKETDGLNKPWDTGGLIYVNPPYGRDIGKWMRKCLDEAAQGAEIVALVPARTGTRWFQSAASMSDAICFVKGRVDFFSPERASTSPMFHSIVLYWGDRVSDFAHAFGEAGFVIGGTA
jgi:DNA N-6-adenine-methyltransferase (Dam).